MAKPTQAQLATHRRQVSRRLAMQALYQWQMTEQTAPEITHQFTENEDYHKADPEYFYELVTEVLAQVEQLDELLQPHLKRSIESVDPVERALLRLAANELMNHFEVPYRVVINEAVSLSKKYGAQEAYKMINGVLDKVAPSQRPLEMTSPP